MRAASPTILVIDPDQQASGALAELLSDRRERPEVTTASSVLAAEHTLRTEPVDWLFIRIRVWDDYQRLVTAAPRASGIRQPKRVVFLSGRTEKCTDYLAANVDAHLRPPYKPGQLAKVWNCLAAPDFRPRPLDIFFLKTQARYVPIRYPDLCAVRRQDARLQVCTRHGEYYTTGSLTAFRARLPMPLAPDRRGWLINEAYEPSPR